MPGAEMQPPAPARTLLNTMGTGGTSPPEEGEATMTQIQTLSDLQPGQSATVRSVCAPDGMQRRLRDLGLIEQTRVVCLGRSPMGDPSAYLIRGSVIALRRCDCRGIRVAVL